MWKRKRITGSIDKILGKRFLPRIFSVSDLPHRQMYEEKSKTVTARGFYCEKGSSMRALFHNEKEGTSV